MVAGKAMHDIALPIDAYHLSSRTSVSQKNTALIPLLSLTTILLQNETFVYDVFNFDISSITMHTFFPLSFERKYSFIFSHFGIDTLLT